MCPAQRIQGFSICKMDLITSDLNRLQHRDIDRLLKIAAIACSVVCLVLRISDKAASHLCAITHNCNRFIHPYIGLAGSRKLQLCCDHANIKQFRAGGWNLYAFKIKADFFF